MGEKKWCIKSVCYFSVTLICLCCFYKISYAIPPSSYWGTWKTQDSNVEITLTIKRKSVTWKVNGEAIQNVEFEYVMSKLPVSLAFLTIYSRAPDKERILYLLLSPGGKDGDLTKLNRLRGNYEYSKLLYTTMEESEQGDGLQRTFLYAVDLVKECEFNETCE